MTISSQSTQADIIITATNDSYLSLALDLIQSLAEHKGTRALDIGVFDVGLSMGSREKLQDAGARIAKPRVDIEYKAREAAERQMPFIRAMTARPFLPDYFPGYRTYMWLDADTWVQTPELFDVVLPAARQDNAIYIAAEFDRDYRQLFTSAAMWQVHLNWYKDLFPPQISEKMSLRPMLNSGVFAMSGLSPVWRAWQDVYRNLLQSADVMKQTYFMAEQLSLNVAVYLNNLPVHLLPAEYNWLSLLQLPAFDKGKGLYVRPSVPHGALSVLHLAGDIKRTPQKIATTDKDTIDTMLTYGAHRARKARPPG